MRIVVLLLFSFNFACLNPRKMNFDKIDYRYQDSSVPPKYHRSYSIIATATSGTIKVDVYGKEIASATFAVSAEQWAEFQKLAQEIEKAGEKIARGATGTSTQILVLLDKNKLKYRLAWDSLSEAKATTEAFAAKVKALVPNLGELRDTEYKED